MAGRSTVTKPSTISSPPRIAATILLRSFSCLEKLDTAALQFHISSALSFATRLPLLPPCCLHDASIRYTTVPPPKKESCLAHDETSTVKNQRCHILPLLSSFFNLLKRITRSRASLALKSTSLRPNHCAERHFLTLIRRLLTSHFWPTRRCGCDGHFSQWSSFVFLALNDIASWHKHRWEVCLLDWGCHMLPPPPFSSFQITRL
jgi:hypothetical protein